MRKLYLEMSLLLVLFACGPSRPLSPEKQAENDSKKKYFHELFDSQSFVLEATTVYGKKGRSFQISPNINFVLLNKGEGAVQLSFNSLVGWNGVGGITLEGRVRNYQVIEGKDNNMPRVKFEMSGSFGWASINISTNSSGNARATIDGYRGENITFTGTLLKLEESSVYKGMSRY